MNISKKLIKQEHFFLYLLFILGVFIFWFSGPANLLCHRVNLTKIDCQIFYTDVLGLFKQKTFYLDNLKNVRIIKKIKENIEAKDNSVTIDKELVYSVILSFEEDKEMLFQSYGYQLQPKQKIVLKIKEFIENSEQTNLKVQKKILWKSITSLVLIFVPIILILKIEFFSTNSETKKLTGSSLISK